MEETPVSVCPRVGVGTVNAVSCSLSDQVHTVPAEFLLVLPHTKIELSSTAGRVEESVKKKKVVLENDYMSAQELSRPG